MKSGAGYLENNVIIMIILWEGKGWVGPPLGLFSRATCLEHEGHAQLQSRGGGMKVPCVSTKMPCHHIYSIS
jgi:hypothetical protein